MKTISGLRAVALSLLVLGLATGCSTLRPQGKTEPEFARSVAESATVAAVAKRGARVCREMRVGIAERDWVRGVVVEADGQRVRVRIDEPGRFPHTIGGAAVVRGAVVDDDAVAWTPCR